jgi:hypothetical protein
MEARHGSIMDRLSHVHDPRRREGRLYKLPGWWACCCWQQ